MKKYIFIIAFFSVTLSLGSCADYLDKSPEANVTQDDVFRKFVSYQGFVEDMYQCIVDVANKDEHGINYWNWGDDFLPGNRPERMGDFDVKGNYWYWENPALSVFSGDVSSIDNGDDNGRTKKGYWDNGWYGIRKANIALQNLNLLVEPYKGIDIEEQRNLIKGQALFFRAYFHFEILRAWGGMPYIDKAISPSEVMRYPRLSYQETAERIDQDLQEAAKLLPEDWDDTKTGQLTPGDNTGRITKGMCYAIQGKNLLYAGSPLMNGVSTGAYSYNSEYCKRAVSAFSQLIALAEKGRYALVPPSRFYENFYKTDHTAPITEEVIFTNPVNGRSIWNQCGDLLVTQGGFEHFVSPTENYAELFGTSNGLTIDDDPAYNPNKPWDNRDPRFYADFVLDGDTIAWSQAAIDAHENIAQFYVGGKHRITNGTQSGYGWKKFRPLWYNSFDVSMANSTLFTGCPKVRLADVYLMYAEAANEAFGPTAIPSAISCSPLSAADAVNIVRDRFKVPHLDSRYTATTEKMRDMVRRERAVELAFENHRWYDLRRWYIAHLPQYKEKYILEFDKDHTYFQKKLFLTKVFDMKHYWLPLPTEMVSVYPGMYQNPGW